ncbi:prepilin-type N-terminal cleavage/methylation domain-containing protein [Opitutaceae bacterium TAV1]|nr:prepilin-type N-terminal cleavage/methylation domain-containing protein [Opitutaceae bacterium TAV1]
MKCPSRPQHSSLAQKHGFTLIELLTVIAIIGILAGILIPVVGAVRDSARSTQCLSNLRQMYVAITMFTDDNKGFLPPASYRPDGGLTTSVHASYSTAATNGLATYISPYMGMPPADSTVRVNRVLFCPAQSPVPVTPGGFDNMRTYGIRSAWEASRGDYPFGNYLDAKAQRMADYVQGKNPRITWAVRDIDSGLHGGSEVAPNRAHKKGRNYLYFDGSVRLLTEAQEEEQKAKFASGG